VNDIWGAGVFQTLVAEPRPENGNIYFFHQNGSKTLKPSIEYYNYDKFGGQK